MPRTNIRALRFAEAAFAVARDSNQLDAWLEALEQASSIFDNHAAGLFLTSPVVPAEQEAGSCSASCCRASPSRSQRFLAILARRDRLELVAEIARRLPAPAQRASGHRGGPGHHGRPD